MVKSERDLGVIIANDTSWNEHLVTIVANANRILGFLRRNCLGLVDREALLHLFCSLVRSHLCYCSQVWVRDSVVFFCFLFSFVCLLLLSLFLFFVFLPIEQVQRRATRFILGRGRDIKLKLLSLNYWLEYLDLVFFFFCFAFCFFVFVFFFFCLFVCFLYERGNNFFLTP